MGVDQAVCFLLLGLLDAFLPLWLLPIATSVALGVLSYLPRRFPAAGVTCGFKGHLPDMLLKNKLSNMLSCCFPRPSCSILPICVSPGFRRYFYMINDVKAMLKGLALLPFPAARETHVAAALG